MRFLYYLYAKGNTVFNVRFKSGQRSDGRDVIVVPICILATAILLWASFELFPDVLNKFVTVLLILLMCALIYGLSYLILPKRTIAANLDSWISRYRHSSNLGIVLYLLSPFIIGFIAMLLP